MKWLNKISCRKSSVTMLIMAMLLISSMTLREYAHFIDHARHFHGQPGSTQPNFDHEAKFHFVTEAESAFEPPCWRQNVVTVIAPLSEKTSTARPHLLPETRAPPASV